MGCPDSDGAQDSGCAVDDGEFVVAGGQATPLLDDVEAAFDDVAALVVCGIECRRSAAACTTAFTVGDQLLWGAAEPLRRMLRILVEA